MSNTPFKPNIFDDYKTPSKIFKDQEALRHTYNPQHLPHRLNQIKSIVEIFSPVLHGSTPSNILIYGKTGTGKTATVKYVGNELIKASTGAYSCNIIYLNCETIDTQYRVLAQITNHILNPESKSSTYIKNVVPQTGWHIDQVYTKLIETLDGSGGFYIVILDEIDKLVKKSSDDVLYNLTRINSDLKKSRLSIVGISNDLIFKTLLDPRVRSSLSEEELVFPPYDASQLQDILTQRAQIALQPGVINEGVIQLCSALAAQEHGDARRALDLLRVSSEIANRDKSDKIDESHVYRAQDKIEKDTFMECVSTLPIHGKMVLCSMLLISKTGQKVFTNGSIYHIYCSIAEECNTTPLTPKSIRNYTNELNMLGIVSTNNVSHGRYGRRTEISFNSDLIDKICCELMKTQIFSTCSVLKPLLDTCDEGKLNHG
ncbi:MAG TPA: ORC1-type DNA replication protein [Methanocorpusculum sp.]|nr:ORC1-type DNA replication protein [Methanocorpusculum sp.]